MNQSVLALVLLFLLAPAVSAAAGKPPSLDVRARVADPREVIRAFADLCIMSPNAAAEDAGVLKFGGTPITETPPPGTPPGRHYDLRLGEVRARVSFDETVCMFDVVATDVPATVAQFDDFLANVFAGMGKADEPGAPPPPLGHIERDLHLAKPGDAFGFRLTLVSVNRPGSPSGMFMVRAFEEANAQAQAAAAIAPPAADALPAPASPSPDVAPSEDISSRANFPPVYPEAAFKACAFGVVKLRVSIDAQGNVLNVAVDSSSRNRDLDRAAIDAARQWRFNPGSAEGMPVGGDIIVPVNFQDPCPREAEPAH